MRKPKDDTPKGGWLGPRMSDDNGDRGLMDAPAIKYAVGVKTVRGKLEWVWKAGPGPVLNQPEAPKVRNRVRK